MEQECRAETWSRNVEQERGAKMWSKSTEVSLARWREVLCRLGGRGLLIQVTEVLLDHLAKWPLGYDQVGLLDLVRPAGHLAEQVCLAYISLGRGSFLAPKPGRSPWPVGPGPPRILGQGLHCFPWWLDLLYLLNCLPWLPSWMSRRTMIFYL